ncbi:MAG: hypothetical protein SFX72_14945 [Isosphaeraceae bacterium]|nr:hypothetical protein [Isosphaeraceae bacterium]
MRAASSEAGDREEPSRRVGMRFLIVGVGPEEDAWADTISRTPAHEVAVRFPNRSLEDSESTSPKDLDDALAWPGLQAVVVGGPIEERPEVLRKTAAAGLNAIALHPPGLNADPYYQVALSRHETGSFVVPDLPARFDPGMSEIKLALRSSQVGRPAELLIDVVEPPGDGDLVLLSFSRWADVARSLLGEVTTISAFGEPPGEHPTQRLTAQLRVGDDKRAEIRIERGTTPSAKIVLNGPGGRWSWSSDESRDLWDPRELMLRVFADVVGDAGAGFDLIDGTRAMELAEGAARSLRRGRTIDLHYEKVSEEANFKTVMTSVGCMILLGILVTLPLALAGPALGLDWLIYAAYAIPPILIAFGLLQLLKLGVRRPEDR